MGMRFVVGLFLIAAPWANEVHGQTRQPPRAMAGCYQATLGHWSSPLHIDHWVPPSTFQLDTTVLSLWLPRDTAWAVQPKLVHRDRLPASWRYTAPDSVVISWSTGFSGVQLRLRVTGDTLRGEAITRDDKHIVGEPPDPRAPVNAIRVPC
jgi:hypothetical protein